MTDVQDKARKALRAGTAIDLYNSADDANKNVNGMLFSIKNNSPAGHDLPSESRYICYAAYDEEGRPGLLREFYPSDAGIVRGKDSCLNIPDSSKKTFADSIKALEKRVKRLISFIEKSSTARNFYSPLRLLYGNGTIYTYTKTDHPGLSFDQYLRKALSQSRSQQSADIQVINILRCIKALADAVSLIHRGDYVLMDISPERFSIPKRADGSFVTDSVYITATDSVINTDDIDADNDYIPCSEGFTSPLMKYHEGEDSDFYKECDAYSVLATLYFAITGTYMPEDRSALLENALDTGLLTESSELMENVDFINSFTKLYTNTVSVHLNGKRAGFTCKDISAALGDMIRKVHYIELQLTPPTPKKKPVGSVSFTPELMFRNIYYRYPLYKAAGETDIRVLIFGSGSLAEEAFSTVFSSGQILGKQLRIAWAGGPEDDSYFRRKMPLMTEFSRISTTGWLTGGDAGYADILLIPKVDRHNEILSSLSPHYIICCQEDDAKSRADASIFIKLCQSSGNDAPFICFTQIESERRELPGAKMLYPINSIWDIPAELNRMAYNCHYMYCRSSLERLSNTSIRSSFSIGPHYRTSIAVALHISYMLGSLGIDTTDPDKAASLYTELLEKQPETLEKLACIEHQRWVAHNITEGITHPEDFSYILRTMSEYGSGKENPAMVRSRSDSSISSDFDWENGDIESFDDLDKASVLINRFYKTHLDMNDHAVSAAAAQLERSLTGYAEATAALRRFTDVMSLILSGFKRGAEDYEEERMRFIEVIEKLYLAHIMTPEDRSHIIGIVDNISKLLFVRIKYLIRTDFKGYDRYIAAHIPFILRFHRDSLLIEEFRKGISASKLEYVADAIDLDVSKIIWTENVSSNSAWSAASRAAACIEDYKNVLAFFRLRNFTADTALHIFIIPDKPEPEFSDELEAVLERIRDWEIFTNSRILSSVRIHKVKDFEPDAHAERIRKLLNRGSSARIISGLPCLTDTYGSISDYAGCRIPKKLSIKEYMSIYGADILSGCNSGLSIYYRDLWALYSDHVYDSGMCSEDAWISFCKMYKENSEENIICTLPDTLRNPPGDGGDSMGELTVDSLTALKMFPLLQDMEHSGILRDVRLHYNENHVRGMTEFDILRNKLSYIITNADTEQLTAIHTAISDTAYTAARGPLAMALRFSYDFSQNKHIITSRNLSFGHPVLNMPEHEDIFHILCQTGLFIKDSHSGNISSYSCCTPSLHDILFAENAALNLFICHALKNSGAFNDVLANLRFRRSRNQRGSAVYGADAAATIGKKAVLISAKACREITENMINSIRINAKSFDAIPILVAGHSQLELSSELLRYAHECGVHIICRCGRNTAEPENNFRTEEELAERIKAITGEY